MFSFLAQNMATIIICTVLLIAVFFAVRYIYRSSKGGGCVGCSQNKACAKSKDNSCGCSGCNCHKGASDGRK